MTNNQYNFLREIKRLDDIQLGCLAVGEESVRDHGKIEWQCHERGWIRSEPRSDTWIRTMYLTTKGLRAFNRATVARRHATDYGKDND